MNPYESSAHCTRTNPDNGVSARRGFRWRVIPAALSWCVGGVVILALPIGIYQNFGAFFPDVDADWTGRMLSYASMATIPVLLAAGLMNLLAGFRWVGGRWGVALILNALAYGVMGLPEVMQTYAIDAAREMHSERRVSE
jgi:hypothetical protein